VANEINQEEKWEFGSLEWCQFAAGIGVKLLNEANLDLSKYQWGFSEEYTHIPERLLAGREKAGFHFMIKDGKISGGASLPEDCLALPGFHVSIEWALIAHASAVIYDLAGQGKRGADAAVLNAELEAAGYGPKISTEKATEKEALAANASEGGGLHNLTAKRLRRSPELDDLPETAYRVPIFTQMTDEQKERFIKLLGR